jgi:hypothetical protein
VALTWPERLSSCGLVSSVPLTGCISLLPIGVTPERRRRRANVGPVASEPVHPPAANQVDWAGLSERSQAPLRTCWVGLLLGYSSLEIAKDLGLSPSAVCDALAQLREEIQAQDGCRFVSQADERGAGLANTEAPQPPQPRGPWS